MKETWKIIAARVDLLSLRERLLLLLSILAIVGVLADQIWLSPAQLQYRQTMQRFTSENLELQRLREVVRLSPSVVDPTQAVRDELAQVATALETTERDIAVFSGQSRTGVKLPEVLVHFLRRHAGLTLVRTTNLGSDVSAREASNRSVGAASMGIVRQGLELTVAGPYPELVKYVQALENALPQMRWGKLMLDARQQPPELSLQVFVMEIQQ